MFGILVKIYST